MHLNANRSVPVNCAVCLLMGTVGLGPAGCGKPAAEPVVERLPLPVEWHRPAETACISLGNEGDFDSDHVFAPCVCRHEGKFRMFYCGSGPQEGRLFKIGIADSEDGLNWTKRPGGAVLAFGDGRTSLVTPALLRHGAGWACRENGKLRMYVVAVDFTGEEVHRLYETTSADGGLTWAPLGGPLMENVYAPSLLRTRGGYRMWYVDASAEPWSIRLAESDDGTHWTPADPGPVLLVDQAWEKERLFYPFVIHDRGRYLMWYGSYWSQRDDTTAIGLALSDDGIHWHKYADNPIIRPDPRRPFESNYCTSHTVLPNCIECKSTGLVWRNRCMVCCGYRIWYATRNEQTRRHKYFAIGTAVSPPPGANKETTVAQPEFSMSAERASDPRLEPLHYLSRFGQETRPSHAFAAGSRDEWQRWHAELRRKLAVAIGLPAMERTVARQADGRPRLRVTKGPVHKGKGYTRCGFMIETGPGLYVPAFLLIPEGLDKPRPAILCSHGHGIGMNALVGLTEEGKERQYKQGYQHDFALQAVKAGFVALAFDQCGFGRRRDIDFSKAQKMPNHCEQPSKNALHWGLSMTGIRVWDALRMIDFLQSRPEVLADKIGMVGISGGGLVTQFTAALDDRIRAACVSGYCNRYADCILSIHHCIDNYVAGLGTLADNDDIACLIAPRPLLIESGTEDPIFPVAATRAAVRKLRRCYKLLNASKALEAEIFEGKHEFRGARTWTFFAEHLGQPE